ncbi:MAG: glycerate 2-kinase [Phycisphaerales bacterium]|jgi:glycerate kinase|nr:glycerate 2-kinase [Phycisphaerales bacterium]
MKVVIAPDKFKDSLSAEEVSRAIARGLRGADVDLCPVADGGEGTVAALVAATGGRFETRTVTGPLPDMRVDATFGILGDGTTAVVEMAAASGLALLPPEDRDPMRTTTYGTGELLLEAAKLGAREIILGIGGSATVDGGIGCAQACGLPVILDEIGPADIREPLVGEDLRRVVLIKHARGSPLDRVKITVACDVTNPLFGDHGAARIFGPQKGATPEQVEELDQLLRQLATRCGKLAEAETPGAGAAGGLGFAMLAFFNAQLRPGFDIVADAVKLRDRLREASLCITGEGRLDASSLDGKAAVGVARLCKSLDVPCIAIVGSADESAMPKLNALFTKILSLLRPPMSLDDAIRNAAALLEQRAAEALAAPENAPPRLQSSP